MAFVSFVLLAGSAAVAGSYPQVAGGPQHVGVAVGSAPTSLTDPRFVVGADWYWRPQSAAVVGLGKVIALADDGDTPETAITKVVAVNERTGQVAWAAEMSAPVWDGWASPAIDMDNGVVIVAAGTETVAFNMSDGTRRWTLPAKPDTTFENSSPTVEAGVVYISEYSVFDFVTYESSDATLYAIDVLSGQIIWEQVVGALSGAHTATIHGNEVLLATSEGHLRFFDKQTGTPGADLALTTQSFGCGVTVIDGAAYLVSIGFWPAGGPTRVYKVDLATHQVAWSTVSVRTDVMPMVTDDLVIVSGGDGYLVFEDDTDDPGLWAFDRTTGQLRWSTQIAGGWASQPLYANGIIYVPSNDGQALHMFDASKTPAEPGFVVGSQSLIANSVAVANGNLYGTGPGGLMAFGPAVTVPGDINNDGYVNVGDLQLLVAAWGNGPGYAGPADLNGDGFVNVGDLQLLVANWGRDY